MKYDSPLILVVCIAINIWTILMVDDDFTVKAASVVLVLCVGGLVLHGLIALGRACAASKQPKNQLLEGSD